MFKLDKLLGGNKKERKKALVPCEYCKEDPRYITKEDKGVISSALQCECKTTPFSANYREVAKIWEEDISKKDPAKLGVDWG